MMERSQNGINKYNNLNANYVNVSSASLSAGCNPCSPDEVRDGSQCNPCHPCYPDQITDGEQCNPCHPCYPDQLTGGSQCNPCHPCYPDQITESEQCNPCNPCNPDQWRDGGNSSGGGCFITSACVETLNLPDDCDELQTLRVLRDKRKLYDQQFSALVEEYYRIAPAIVSAIDHMPDRLARYRDIYERMVVPCVAMVKQNRENDAVQLYTDTVLELKCRYLGEA